MSEPLKPQCFLTRPNGIMVPLIAMDELPYNIRIESVDRVLASTNMGSGIIHVGTFNRRHATYQIYDVNKQAPAIQLFKVKNKGLNDLGFDGDLIPTPPCSPPTPPASEIMTGVKRAYDIQEQPQHQEDKINISRHQRASSNPPAFGNHEALPAAKNKTKLGRRLPPPGKKVYCSHWMSTGNCDYVQQGCIYRHEMPLDLDLLNALGFQDIPLWCREKHGIGKLTAVPGSGSHARGLRSGNKAGLMQSSWRPTVGANTNRGPRPPTSSRTPSFPRVASAGRVNGHMSLLDSKYDVLATDKATVPALGSADQSGCTARYSNSSVSKHTTRPDSPATSIESLASADQLESINFSGKPLSRQRWTNLSLDGSVSRSEVPTGSRRSSIASDVETQVIFVNKQRQDHEDETYAKVIAVGRQEQVSLIQMQEDATAVTLEKAYGGASSVGSRASAMDHKKAIRKTTDSAIRRPGKQGQHTQR